MKWLIASDIHGSAYYTRKLLEAYDQEGADRLLLLGDILYHGPRNDLPKDYAPKEVISMLNPLADRILCVRGNCDTEVDQMVLSFPILAEYALLSCDKKLIFATHGHNFNNAKLPAIKKGDILLHGHTHVPACEEFDTYTYINPGSVSIPKENSPHSFATFDGKEFLWKDLNSENLSVYKSYTI
ncbi:MAG: phosphodiesterase [Ruminococcus sp.]|nr:phosphodiesterase [Ruminococcus sp.]